MTIARLLVPRGTIGTGPRRRGAERGAAPGALLHRPERAISPGRDYTSRVAEPARRTQTPAADEPPIADPDAIRRAYRRERAKRRARIEHRREAKVAGVRFWVVLWVLLFASVILALTIWAQIQQLFGL